MIGRKVVGAFVSLAVAVTVLLGLAAVCGAAEFSADSIITSNGMTMSSRIYVKGSITRTEMSGGPMGQMTTIVRPDKGLVWSLQPANKTYTEAVVKSNKPGQSNPLAPGAWKNAPGLKKIGSATIQGYKCDKYMMPIPKMGPAGKQVQMPPVTLWYSKKLGYMLKREMKNAQMTMVTEIKNIKQGKQPKALFEVPRGYKKQALPENPMFGQPQ